MEKQNVENEQFARAVDKAIARGLSFFAVAEPQQSLPTIYVACADGEGEESMTFAPFDSSVHPKVAINGRPLAEGDLDRREASTLSNRPVDRATDKETYLKCVSGVISALKDKPEWYKTVVSRVIKCRSGESVSTVALRYFDQFPETFRYIWNHPSTGLWIGATPELLLDYRDRQCLKTMALAGTRLMGESGPWDRKNRLEHDAVTRFIVDTLTPCCKEVVVGAECELPFGKICHLCTPVAGIGLKPDIEIDRLIDTLSPTPAVSGYPRRDATTMISAVECHDRRYYGGYIQFKGRAWVNLRCAMVSVEAHETEYTVISGGGVTAQSNAEDEWHETELKSRPLVNAVAGPSDYHNEEFELKESTIVK